MALRRARGVPDACGWSALNSAHPLSPLVKKPVIPEKYRDRDVITGVLLAAGRSSRFGSDKLMEPLSGGLTVAEAAATTLLSVLSRMVAVVRPGNSALVRSLSLLGVETRVFDDADSGMGASLAYGVDAEPDAEAWLIALADMPFIQAGTVEKLHETLLGGAPIVAPFYDGVRGHPVGFAQRFHKELVSLEGEQGARSVISRHVKELVPVPVNDAGVLWDIDTQSDLRGTRHLHE